MSITMQDIANMAGVSRGTVDRAINNRGRIDPKVRDKILGIAEENGYFNKKSPIGKKKIGVITQLNNAPFMTEIHRGIRHAASKLKYRNVEMVLKSTDGFGGKEQVDLIDEITKEGIDGLAIMASDSADVQRKVSEIKETGMPVITFNSDLRGSSRDFYIGMDNKASGKTGAGLMNMLLGGKGSVLIITGYFTNDVDNMRVEGFTEEIRNSFTGLTMMGVQGCFEKAEEVKRILNSMTDSGTMPDGIFMVSSGQEGLKGALNKMKSSERPKVIVYDNTEINRKLLKEDRADFILDQQGFIQGYKAVEMLADLVINGKHPETEHEYTETIIYTKYNI